jgi:hypothetical protein
VNRAEREKKKGKLIVNNITDVLKNKSRLSFNNLISKGGRLSVNEIGSLNAAWKNDYTGVLLNESKEIVEDTKKGIEYLDET